MARSRSTIQLISRITGELTTTALDLVILSTALAGGIILFGPRGKDLYASKKTEAAVEMASLMFQKWNESSFRRAIGRAVGEGLVKRISDGVKLTESGRRRLGELLPSYKQSQSWDGKLWLVTYDISEDKRRSRDRFRNWLFEIGCRMIQESVWISMKDPKPWIKNSISSMKKRSIIVSCLGKDGSIGSETVNELIYRVFKLKSLDKAYKQWIRSAEKPIADKSTTLSLGFRYLSLLKQDPMLPQEILPSNWTGHAARKIFESKIEPEMGTINAFL